MPEGMKCPECASINIEEIPYKAAAGPGTAHAELLKKAENYRYRCLDCGLLSLESNLRE